ncbi:hypothetical protein DM02DRAFT_63153 [Periconia macrospinosa]|uniref:Uncharacterized protein n=1 Tax=Periconia macrospinosa TaxID=97972 RepID=A0A2V1DLF6_9PLEO|nr:hypothetical protein DM02DRAFT_63153 [Periconia macrospinosa]
MDDGDHPEDSSHGETRQNGTAMHPVIPVPACHRSLHRLSSIAMAFLTLPCRSLFCSPGGEMSKTHYQDHRKTAPHQCRLNASVSRSVPMSVRGGGSAAKIVIYHHISFTSIVFRAVRCASRGFFLCAHGHRCPPSSFSCPHSPNISSRHSPHAMHCLLLHSPPLLVQLHLLYAYARFISPLLMELRCAMGCDHLSRFKP